MAERFAKIVATGMYLPEKSLQTKNCHKGTVLM